MKKIILFFVIFVLFVSCKKIYNLRNAKPANEQIVEDLYNKKIIFIGENHTDIYPIFFMTEHLEDFYNAGLRYLFLEAIQTPPMDATKNYKFLIMPMWINAGWKYEEKLFFEKINEINKKYLNDPIRICFPEEGFEEKDYTYDIKGQSNLINNRDYYSQQNIINSLSSSQKNDKAIVFFGANHGYKTNQLFYDYNWKALGVYLSDYYDDNFTNYKIDCFFPSRVCDLLLAADENCFIVPENIKSELYGEEFLAAYNNLCITKQEKYGVSYSYIPIRNHANCLLEKIIDGEKKIGDFSRLTSVVPGSESFQFLLSIYYLKYYFDDLFIYNYFDNYNDLEKCINNLFELVTDNGYSNFWKKDWDITLLEEYSKYMYCYGYINEYLIKPNIDFISYIINSMQHAKEIAPNNDIWPQYWIAYFKTEQAMYSEKKSDYKKALKEWEELFQNELLYVSPVLKLAYEKAALCEEKTGNIEKADYYRQKETQVKFPFDFDYKEYVYFGW